MLVGIQIAVFEEIMGFVEVVEIAKHKGWFPFMD